MDFRAAHIRDKFWSSNSIVVPKELPILDDRFETLEQIFSDHTERDNFEIYWTEYGVKANVRLAGEFNYCYYEGNFYHLEKTRCEGFIQNGTHDKSLVWDYYMEYDD